jgi:hypothetical protein
LIKQPEKATHIVIPDSQIKAGVPTAHLEWIGRYLVDTFAGHPNVKVIHLGDFADMPSLSSYDKGKRSMEGRRYRADIQTANDAFALLNEPLIRYNAHRKQLKERQWWPDLHMLHGNHEDRITRAVESDAQLEDLLSLDDLRFRYYGWLVHPFLQPVVLDGIHYSHYFYNPMNGRPYGGNALARLKTLGFSYVMGHQQTLDYAVRYVGNQQQRGLICGTGYLHDEQYLGYQGNDYFRGILVLHNVQDGGYELQEVSFESLCQRYEGRSLTEFLAA